ncbi:MAG: T9SS type A sorting domain-containing protein [Bacteroidetes bacterium]|nr:T9SS type A sorting domain-containing protein [Bacteroidota bacterium]MBK7968706.1 T9SS type A sorting domain-containing protein [Bacteroidota bacterium]MBK9423790.1 T9SS type A sorting domain-containing protein [Bacteroidota bacterium]
MDSLPGTLMSNPFPNPANNYFEVNITIPETQIPYNGNSEVELLLFDIEGKQLALKQITTNTKSIHFDISDLAAGTYYVVLSLNGYNAGGKVIVKN